MSSGSERTGSADLVERHSRSAGGDAPGEHRSYGHMHESNGTSIDTRQPQERSLTGVWWRRAARTGILFAFGCAYSFVLNVAQAVGESVRFRPGDAWLSSLLRATWWLPPVCGCVAVTLGMLIPALDRRWGAPGRPPEPARTVRLLLVMLGVNHASTRVPLADAPAALGVALSASLCAALWLVFDRSPAGLALASACYALAHALGRVLDARGLYDLEHVDAGNVARWLPTIFFAAAIMLATLGRQLAYSFAPNTPTQSAAAATAAAKCQSPSRQAQASDRIANKQKAE